MVFFKGTIYFVNGDADEAYHSFIIDLTNLNPLRIPRNVIHGIASVTYHSTKGVWIGKRPIGRQLIALNITLGIDAYHWCIQINGIIYQLSEGDNCSARVRIR